MPLLSCKANNIEKHCNFFTDFSQAESVFQLAPSWKTKVVHITTPYSVSQALELQMNVYIVFNAELHINALATLLGTSVLLFIYVIIQS